MNKMTTKHTKFTGAKVFSNHVKQNDVVRGIVPANAGIDISQLVRDDASIVVVKTRKSLGGKFVRDLVATIEEKGDYGDRTFATVSKLGTDPRKLKLDRIKV